MWDIISYDNESLTLSLRNRHETALFSYPWDKITSTGLPLDSTLRAETINIEEKDVFSELAVRVRFFSFCHLCSLSRSSLNGKMATSAESMHREALKFAIKRYEKKLISANDFLLMIRSAAIYQTIPIGFWERLHSSLTKQRLQNLKESMESLSIFRPRSINSELEDWLKYMSRVLWFTNSFEDIRAVCKQILILHPSSSLKEDFAALSDQAASLIKRQEIEAEQATKKPWQKSVPSHGRQIRVGPPRAKAKKKEDRADENDE